jgi:hypothetical protein
VMFDSRHCSIVLSFETHCVVAEWTYIVMRFRGFYKKFRYLWECSNIVFKSSREWQRYGVEKSWCVEDLQYRQNWLGMYLFKHHDSGVYFFVCDAFFAPFNLTVNCPIVWWYMLISRWHWYMICVHSNMQLMRVICI